MDICSVADRTYLRYYATLLASIAYSNPAHRFRFHLLYESADGSDLRLFREFSTSRGLNVKIHSVTGSDIARLCEGIANPAAYYRFLIPELLPEATTALYLDVDIVVLRGLDDLLSTDLSNVGAAVVRAYYREHKLEAFGIGDDRYFNNGMMLMNLDYWREHCVAEKALHFAAKHPDLLVAPDQDAINFVLKDQVLYLDPKWNCTRAHAKRYEVPNPIIVHYAGRTKPWVRPWRLPYGIYYASYSQMTPWPIDYFNGEKAERQLPRVAKRLAERAWSRACYMIADWRANFMPRPD